MHDPFNLTDAVIRDLPHVRVTRHAPTGGRSCEYRKIFKSEGLGDASYWVQRENDFLLDFTVKRLRHAVELAAFAQRGLGQQTPVVEFVATRDAGVTVEDWLRVQPRYENGAVWLHPFQHAGLFLELLRACLVALKEIHALGIVHCDIKEDNICLPYTPYPYQEGQPVRLDFERVRLIDFAFSVTPERPLEHPLPILPTAPYQSNLLKTALSGDRSGKKNRGGLAVQQLDYRVDLYSLGFLAGRILNAGLLQPAGSGGLAAMEGARALVEQLQAYGDSQRRTGRVLPHHGLIADIDSLLDNLVDVNAYRRFEVVRLRDSSTLGGIAADNENGIGPTPITPLASFDEATPLLKTKPARRSWRWPVLLLTGLSAAGLIGYWQSLPSPTPPSPIDKKTPPATKANTVLDDEAKRAEQEAQWKADAEALFQAEEAKAKQEEARQKADSEARAKMELAEEIRAEAERKAVESPTDGGFQGAAVAEITWPEDGDSVERSVAIQGGSEGISDSQHAFLIVRSKAEAYGRLYYPQGELPRAAEWSVKGIFATPNYEYEVFVVVTENLESVDILRDMKSRAHGLKNLPLETTIISDTVTVIRRK